jgi:class 3 adenylate cyclase/tetratricopeptide (TPR) repeat protein
MTETATAPPDVRTELLTFLFADVRGYTRFTQEQGNEAAAQLVTKFAGILRQVVRARSGKLVELRGDEALAVFGSARQALRAAVDLQARFAAETEHDPSLPLPVGIGLDAGEAVEVEGGYRGEALNLAARLCNLAGPGEVLASEGVVYLGRRVQGLVYAMRGTVPMKGIAEPVGVIRVLSEAEAAGSESDATPDPPAEAAMPIGGFLGALPSGALVGRDREWEQIMAALEAVAEGGNRRTGSTPLLLLAGEPGIGKTRLAQELTLKARHWHFLVATGRCYDLEQAVPYYPFLEALATVYSAAPAYVRAEIPRRWPYLARLLPEGLGISGPALPSRQLSNLEQEDQQRLFRAVTGFLEAVAEIMPIALLIDDLHWADDASLKLLLHLARFTGGSRILLVGTYRDVEVNRQHPLEALLRDLGREHLLTEVEVRRLNAEETAELVAEIIGEKHDLSELADLVYRRTNGNAFFIEEVMRALMERGEIYRQDGHWELRAVKEMEVPKSIRSVIGQRLGQLDERSQDILREASVLGQEFAFDDLLGLIARAPVPRDTTAPTEDEIENALERGIESGLLRETSPDRYAFNHALTQQALYDEISTRRRKRLHLAAAQALEALVSADKHGCPVRGVRERRAAELAWHFLEGDDGERALHWALLAGEAAEAVFANGDAERHYRTALELSHELNDRAAETQALQKLAGVLSILGQYDKAIELLERAARVHHAAGNVEAEALTVAQLGHVHFQRGTQSEGIARLRPLVETLDAQQAGSESEPPSYGLAALWAALARLYLASGPKQEQLEAAERAVELARVLPETDQANRILIGAEITRADALWYLGQQEETLRVMEDLIPRAEAAGDLDSLARALRNAALYSWQRGELEQDRSYHERMLELAERRGDRSNLVLALLALSQNAFLLGDWRLARAYLDRTEESIRALHGPRLSLWPYAARAWLELREGDTEAAGRLASEAISLAEDLDIPVYARSMYTLLAERALGTIGDDVMEQEAGREALALLEPLADTPQADDDIGYMRTLAWAHLAAGDGDEAVAFADAALREARASRSQPDLVEALAIHGMVLARQGRYEEAEWDFAEAVSLARGMSFPFGEARALEEWGRMEAARGHADLAREKLDRASTIVQGLRAVSPEA